MADTGYWGLVVTRANQERTAQNNAMRQGYRAYLPMFRESTLRQGRLMRVARALFPRYMFVWIAGPWSSLTGTFGVSSVLMDGDKPRRVPERVVEGIRGGEDEAGFVIVSEEPTGLVAGANVMLSDGGSICQRAIYQGMRGDDRAAVLLRFLGADRTVVVPRNLLSAA